VEYLRKVADLTGAMSTCSRLQVGVVLTDLRMEQMWVGYNGGPRGGANECRHPDQPGYCGCVHAEANAVIKAPGDVDKVAVLTHSPCVNCAVMLVNANVRRLYFETLYRSPEGLIVLDESDVMLFSTKDPLRRLHYKNRSDTGAIITPPSLKRRY
jgi:dCMP deaminase